MNNSAESTEDREYLLEVKAEFESFGVGESRSKHFLLDWPFKQYILKIKNSNAYGNLLSCKIYIFYKKATPILFPACL